MIDKKNLILMIILVLVGCTSDPGDSTHLPDLTPTRSISTLIPSPMPVEVLTSLPYAENELRQNLDVYLPIAGQRPFPTIMAIHGGAFRFNSKSIYEQLGLYFAQRGYAFVAINYRLAPKYHYPDQVEDSFCALAWLYANHEEYGFDPDRVVVMGGSAGGYLAAMVSTLDNPSLYLEKCPNNYPSRKVVRAAVIFYGFFDFTDLDAYHESDIESFSMFWGAKQNEIPAELFIEMSPAKQIDGSEPPFILLHGTADYFVPSEISENFAKSLSQAGVDVELVLVPDAGHAFETKPLTGEEMSFSLGKIEAFLDRVLTP